MLLIVFLGLIANLALFCDGCDIGTTHVNNFVWNNFLGKWWFKSHYNNYYEDWYDCTTATIYPPFLGFSYVKFQGYVNGTQLSLVNPSFATDWNSTGYFYLYTFNPYWTGQYYVIATDYNSYVILKLCPFYSNQVSLYVWYRTPHPDASTVQVVENELVEYNINSTQLVDWPDKNC